MKCTNEVMIKKKKLKKLKFTVNKKSNPKSWA